MLDHGDLSGERVDFFHKPRWLPLQVDFHHVVRNLLGLGNHLDSLNVRTNRIAVDPKRDIGWLGGRVSVYFFYGHVSLPCLNLGGRT